MGGGLAIFCRSMYLLRNQGSHTLDSYEMNSRVGTENTSAKNEYRPVTSKRPLTVQLLKRELFGLPDETEDHAPSDEVETGVETD